MGDTLLSSEIVKRDARNELQDLESKRGLIKDTLCRGASDAELELFMYQCKRTGLDPFSRQIYAIKRWDSALRRDVMSVQTSIDGFRLIAERTGENNGQDGPYWCGPDGVWRDVWLAHEPPSAAKITVYRKEQTHGYTGIALWDEYVQTTKEGKVTSFWSRMPANQLAKCAEALALRKGFPQELSGLYTGDEIGQAHAATDGHDHDSGTLPQPKVEVTTEDIPIENLVDKKAATAESRMVAREPSVLPQGVPALAKAPADPGESKTQEAFATEYINLNKQRAIHRHFRDALPPEIQTTADGLLADWLRVKKLMWDGKPSTKVIREDQFDALLNEAVAFAKGMATNSLSPADSPQRPEDRIW